MSDSLRKHLGDLHILIERCKTDKGIQLNNKADQFIKDIKHMINGYKTESELELCASLLFNDKYSLLNFMRKTHNTAKFPKCVESGLQLIQIITLSWENLSSSYIRIIASTMLEMYPSCTTSSLKEKIIHILISIVEKAQSKNVDYNTIKKLVREELDKKTGSSSSVKCAFLHLIGLLCQYYPDEMRDQFERLVVLYLRKLQHEFDRSSDLKIIEGCLKGLCCVLFKHEIDSSSQRQDIYKYSMKSMQPKEDLNRYAVPIAGLKMIQHHVHLFGCFVVEHYKKIYEVLERWLKSSNPNVKHEAHLAILSYLKQIVEAVDNESDVSVSREIYMFFVTKFQTIIESAKLSSKEVSIAIQGYGMFAKLCRKYMDRDYLPKMLSVMMSKTSRACFRSKEKHFQGRLDQVYQMSNFLSSLAYIMKEVVGSSVAFSANNDHGNTIISECFITQVLQICLHVLEGFHFLPAKDRASCCLSLVSVMSSFSPYPDHHQTFVSKFVSRGLEVGIFSNLGISQKMHQTEELNDINSDSRMEKANMKYIALWKGILSTPQNVSSSAATDDVANKNHIQTQKLILKEILQTSHKMLQNMEPGNGRQVRDMKEIPNHDIIKELARFWDRLLSVSIVSIQRLSRQIFTSQASSMTQTLLRISSSSHLSVGAYDMLTTLVTACDNLGYFSYPSSMDDTSNSLHITDAWRCLKSITKSVPEIVARITESDLEATYSSLLFLLSFPSEIALDIKDVLVKPLQMAFRLGLGNANLADAALNALDKWKLSKESTFPTCFVKVLPDIALYISGDDLGNARADSLSVSIDKTTSSVAGKTMKEVKKKALQFLGSVCGCFPLSALTEDPELKKVSLETDLLQDQLCYIIPLPGTDVKLPLAQVISHACELAGDSTDRQAKLTACEVLHSVMIFIIGQVRQIGLKQSSSTWGEVYQYLMPGVIKLGCDSDPVAKTLFESLVMQIIHWFAEEDGPNAVIILDVIMNGLVDESDEFRRNFCAQCLGEFVISISRQYGDSNDAGAELARPVFEQLCNFANHPNSDIRRSTAIGFSALHNIIGESRKLLDEFIFQLLSAFVRSLTYSHTDSYAIGTERACSEALRYMENLIIANKDLLIMKNKKRKGFPGLDGNAVCLETVVEWLLKQSARTESACRKFCMESVMKLSTLLPNAETFQQWIHHYIDKHGADQLCSIFNGGIIDLHESSVSDIAKGWTIKHTRRYLELLLASLDCYYWAISNELISPDQLAKGSIVKLLSCVDHFITEIMFSDHRYLNDAEDRLLSHEVEVLTEEKCEVAQKALELAQLLFRSHYVREEYVTKPILDLIASCLLEPVSVGFDAIGEAGEPELFSTLVCNLISDMDKWPDSIKRKSVLLFRDRFKLNEVFVNPMECIKRSKCEGIYKLVWTYRILLKSGCLQVLLPEMTVDKQHSIAQNILNFVFSSFANVADSYNPILWNDELTSQKASYMLLKLAFDLGVKSDDIVDLISNKPVLHCSDGKQLSTQGALFFSKYKTILCEEICAHPHEYLAVLSKQCTTEMGIRVLNGVIDILSEDRILCSRLASEFVESVFTHWLDHITQLTVKETPKDSTSALLLISRLIALHPKVASDVNNPKYETTFHIFSNTLKSKILTLQVKNEILSCLHHFVPTNCGTFSESLKNCLLEFCSIHFPSQSTEFEKGSQQLDDYLISLKCILQALEKTGSPEIMSVLASVFCREPNHILKDEFVNVLSTCMHSVSDTVQREAIDRLYALHSSSPHPVLVRCRIGDMILLPLLSQCNREISEAFFVSHIGQIMGCIAEDLQKVSANSWKDKLSLKSSAYKLVQVMFSSLPKDVVTLESSELIAAFASSTIGQGSTKMLKNFMSWILRDKSQDVKLEKKLLGEELRQFNCCVFNAVIAAVICTQTEMKWFDAFIFSHNPKKNELLFENIIDENKVYNFPLRKMYDTYTSKVSTKPPIPVKMENETYDPTISSISSFRYDAAHFDMNAPTGSASNDYVDARSELEHDAMNEHECMQNLVCAVFNMKEKLIGFPVEYASGPPAKWMTTLVQRMNSEAHINVKIFIVKLVINCGSVLEPYCTLFLMPMIKVIVQYMKKGSTGSHRSKIDQFVNDALITILCWNHGAPSKENHEEKLHIRALVEILMQHCPNEDQIQFKRNLRLFKATLSCFKKRLSNVNTDFIYHYSAGSSKGSSETLHSLHLLASLLSNGFSPYNRSIDVKRLDYFERIFGHMLQPSKIVIDVASGIMGMSLKCLSQYHNETAGEIHDLAKSVLRNFGNSAKRQGSAMATFISSLFKVAKYYPPVVQPFISDILYLLPKVPSSDLKVYCVETVRVCMSDVDNIIAELKAKNFFSMLIYRDEPLQHCCMKLLNQLVDLSISSVKEKKFDLDHFNECIDFFLPHVRDHMVGDQSFDCRQEMYAIAMKVLTFQIQWKSHQHSNAVFNDSKYILIHGLGDSEEVLRLQVTNFWTENLHLIAKCDMSDLGGRLMALFEYLYTPEADELGFLTSCCDILMRSTCQNPRFSQDIFSRSLFDCQYEDLSLSQYLDSSQKLLKNYHEIAQSGMSMMETDTMKHETQTPSSTQGTFNWMTGETYCDTVVPNEETLSKTQYSSMTSEMQGMKRRRMYFLKELASRDKLSKKTPQISNDHEGSLSHGSQKGRLRMYRTYRTGKLPDLKISHRDILIPLTALTQCSADFLRSLMSTLINAILHEQKRNMNMKYLEEFSEVLKGMLSKSKQHNPTFIACILTVILTNITSLSIDISVVSQVAKKSGQTHLGIRIIEEKLMLSKEGLEPKRKRPRVSGESSEIGDDELHEWMSLARLYSNDFDTLRGIFSIPAISGSRFKKVMHLESEGEYKEALKIYEEALTEEVDSQTNEVEKTLWEDCLINCLEKLTKWKEVDKFCMKQMDGSLGNSVDKPEFQERFLLPSLHAKSYLMMKGSLDSQEDLWEFLADSLNGNEVEKKIVERDHCYLIALVQAHKGDYGQALFYLDLALGRIGNTWKTHDKGKVMSQLMHFTDLEDYLQLMRKDARMLSVSMVEELCHRWGQRLPYNQVNSLDVWEDISTNRCYFLDHLVQSLPSSSEQSSVKKLVAELKIDMYVDGVNQACREKCFNKAGKFINENVTNILQSFSSTDETNFLGFFKHSIGLGRYYLNLSHHLMAHNKSSQYLIEAASNLVESYRCLKEASQSHILNEHQSKRSMVFTLLGQNLKLMMDLVEYKNVDSTVLETIGGLIGSGIDGEHIEEMIGQEGYNILKKTVDETSESCRVTNNCVEMFITFAKLCDQVLQNNDLSRAEDITDTREGKLNYAKEIIRYTLCAMQHGGKHESSQEAIIKFPRLLQLVDQFPEAKSFFSTEAEEVPTWMFLKWISQMVAILDKPEADAVHSIIYKLSEEYPQAVIYAVKTSLSQFRFEKSDSGKRNKNFVARLVSHLDLKVPEASTFIKNLILLANPHHIFKSWHDTACNLLRGGDSASHSLLYTNYQNMYNELFASHFDDGPQDSIALTLHERFAKEFRDRVDKAFGGTTGGRVLLENKNFRQAATPILKDMQSFCENDKSSSLKEYSHWLATFHVTCSGGGLEIPGQYNKVFGKPMPEYHVKIVGFEDSVFVIGSLQRPKKIVVKGSDSKKYPYMVKGNEDLRQDQRIQQLFETVNIALQRDPECFHRNLKVETYQVIPVTDRLGLVEWVENSPTLQETLTRELKRTNRYDCLGKASKKYSSWLDKYAPKLSPARSVDVYGNMVKQAKFKDVSAIYNAVVAEMPSYILRNSLQRLCTNPETFLTLRKRFVSVYGTLCAIHWILGIGDRHASNCLISEKSGSVIGIDFGHAFGSATEILPVPELVPFRLTSQIGNVMVPHPIKDGLLRQCMLYSLHALRKNQEIIFAMLDIFLKEPSIDWIKRAGKLSRQQENSSGKSTRLKNASRAWYPSKKIDHVKAKLQGGNPVSLLREELLCNSCISSYVEDYRAVAEGTGDMSRMMFPSNGLSVDQQVDCLLHLATDPNVLGRTYSGWRFWL